MNAIIRNLSCSPFCITMKIMTVPDILPTWREKEIPLGARILRVSDTFAALISDRPYRKAFSMEEAVALMIDEIKDFDVGVFLAFQRVVHGPHIEEIMEINKAGF